MKEMVLGLWLPSKVENKEDDGHCCSSCEKIRIKDSKEENKSEREGIQGRRNLRKRMKVLLHRKSRRELRMNLACGIQSLKGVNKEEGWLVSGFNEVREGERV